MKKKILFGACGLLMMFMVAGNARPVFAADIVSADTTITDTVEDAKAVDTTAIDTTAVDTTAVDTTAVDTTVTGAASATDTKAAVDTISETGSKKPADLTTVDTTVTGTTVTDTAPAGATAAETTVTDTISAPDLTTTADIAALSDAAASSDSLTVQGTIADGWTTESGQTYYYEGGVKQTGWLVTAVAPFMTDTGLERYWLKIDGSLAVSELISANEAGWAAYARPEGYVVRGKYVSADGKTVYLADNDGELENPGWHVTSAYDSEIQRYYISDGSDNAENAYKVLTGEFTVDTKKYYGLENLGYELRGDARTGDGTLRRADNDGVLTENGWVVTDGFGQELQRYWFQDAKVLVSSLIDKREAGWEAYATPEGYVVRGKYVSADGLTVYLADNDGELENPGWHVTSAYDSELQRYYISDGSDNAENAYKALTGEFTVDTKNYYGLENLGYELRGDARTGDGTLRRADNDGVLTENGWVVTDGFGQGLQRYWFQDAKVLVSSLIDKREAGWEAYATPEGYVVRGKYVSADGLTVYLADNDGELENPGWLVTSAYDSELQRYYISDGSENAENAYKARIGEFTVDANRYYGLENLGYELRGDARTGDGTLRRADNDGVLTENGWVVTDDFGQELQRYWFQDAKALKSSLVDEKLAGWAAYASSEWFVVRGKYALADGTVYLADNDGKLEQVGWLITDRYDGEYERYYIDETTRAAKKGAFSVDGDCYYGLPTKGYVLRGSVRIDNTLYYADNDGRVSPAYATDTSYGKGSARSIATYVEEIPYLFLPSFADISKFTFSFTRLDGLTSVLVAPSLDGAYSETSSGTVLNLTSMGVSRDDDGAYILYIKQAEGKEAGRLAIMISANIRAMYIISKDPVNYGRSYIESSAYYSAKTTGTMVLVDPDGTVVYNQGLDQIKGRGNTSWFCSAKKPYQIKLSKKTDLLETGNSSEKNKTWCLLAEAFDSTLIHNRAALAFAQELGIKGASGADYIDLYYDGEYRGTYLLAEKVEINTGRVDITDLEEETEDMNPGVDFASLGIAREYDSNGNLIQYVTGIQDPADITGGYLLELDGAYYSSETSWFTIGGADSGIYFVSKSPEYLSKAQAEYICGYVQEVYDCLVNGGVHPGTGKTIEQYLDVDSFAKDYMLNEYLKVLEYMYSSTYFCKDTGGKLTACSPWDFDRCGGVRTERTYFNAYSGIYTAVYSGDFAALLMKNSTVQMAVKNIWNSTVLLLARNVVLGEITSTGQYLKSLSYYYSEVNASRVMNFKIWVTPKDVDDFVYASYDDNYQYFVNWLAYRTQWLETEIASWDGSAITNAATEYNGTDYVNVYDYQYYSTYSDLISAGIASDDERSLQHFVEYGMSEGRQASLNFNPQAYRYYNADLAAAYGDDWKAYYTHYIVYGKYEGRCAVW